MYTYIWMYCCCCWPDSCSCCWYSWSVLILLIYWLIVRLKDRWMNGLIGCFNFNDWFVPFFRFLRFRSFQQRFSQVPAHDYQSVRYCIYCTLTLVMITSVKVIRRLIDVTVNIRNFTEILIFERRNIESLLT